MCQKSSFIVSLFSCVFTLHMHTYKRTMSVSLQCAAMDIEKNRDLNLVLFCSLQNVAVQSSIFSHHKYIYKYT
uniref:Secreted protein n=1 Tax=Anguilla anguilla TaxID=7936 RepID=A0A0E9XJX4_ANGAN